MHKVFRNETWFPIFHLYRSKIEENVFSSDDIKVFLKKKLFIFVSGNRVFLHTCGQDCAAAKVMRRWYDDQVKKKWMDFLFPKQCSVFRKCLLFFTSQEHNYDFDTHHAKGGAGSVSECA